MPSYPELGRHTPPPPPYSSSQRNCSNAVTTWEASQSNPPPPPPPSLHSTQGKEFSLPSPRELEQAVASDDPYLRHSSNAVPAQAVPFQLAAAQPIEYQTRNQYREFIRFGIPVEPKLGHGPHGHSLPPFDSLSIGSRSEPVPHQSLVHDQGAERRPDYYTSATQTLNTPSLGPNVTSYATQYTPHALAVDDRQPLPPFRGYSSTTIPSLAYPNGLDFPAPVNSSGNMYPPSTLPSQQTIDRRSTLTAVSTTTTTPKAHPHAAPTQPTTSPNERTSQGPEHWRRVSQSNRRRPSVSVRFEPYRRRQSSIGGENTEHLRHTGEADKEPAKGIRVDSDLEIEQRGRQEEGEDQH